MPKGYRGVLVALGLILVGVLFYAGYDELQHADKPAYADYKYQPARDRLAPLPGKDPKVTAYPYQPYCDEPKERDDADLCAQWAAVQAVNESNRLSRISITVTGLEFGALIVSLLFTGWAAMAAAKAARIAEEATNDAEAALAIAERNANHAGEQVKVAQDTAYRQLRAYLSVTSIHILYRMHIDGVEYKITIGVKNTGLTPGIITRIATLFYCDWFSIPPLEGAVRSIAPGVEAFFELSHFHDTSIRPTEMPALHCEVQFTYADYLGNMFRGGSDWTSGDFGIPSGTIDQRRTLACTRQIETEG